MARPKSNLKRIPYSTTINEKSKEALNVYKSLGIQGNDIIECLIEMFFDYLNPALLKKYKAGRLRSEDLNVFNFGNISNHVFEKTQNEKTLLLPDENSAIKPKKVESTGFQNGSLDNLINEDDLLL